MIAKIPKMIAKTAAQEIIKIKTASLLSGPQYDHPNVRHGSSLQIGHFICCLFLIKFGPQHVP